MKKFGNVLKELRNEKHLTGEELGKALSVTKVAISNWENGNRTPDTDMLKKIANYFDVSLDYLLGRTDERNLNTDKPQLNENITTISAHRINGDIDNLPDEAIDKINDYIEMIKLKYNR